MNPAAQIRSEMQSKWPGATVFKRGKGYLKMAHPSVARKRSLDTQVGAKYHKGNGPWTEADEIDTAWVVSSGAWDYEVTKNDFYCYVRDSVPVSYRYVDGVTSGEVELTVDQPQWVNDAGDKENLSISFSQVTPSINDDTIRWNDIAPGWDIAVQAQTARLAKRVYIESLGSLGDAPTVGGVEYLSFQLKFQKTSGLDIWINGVLWNEKNNNPQQTDGIIEFRDASQNVVFSFQVPWAVDADDSQPSVVQYVRNTGNQLWIEVRVPWSWLQSANYPIEIDPTIDEQVGASTDDAYEDTTSGSVNVTDTRVRAPDSNREMAGFRWTTVDLESTDTIDVAYFQLRVFTDAGDDPSCDWEVENADSPATFSTASNDLSNRTVYGTSVAWDDTNIMTGGEGFYSSPSIVSLIEAVIAGANWDNNDPIVLLGTYNGSYNGGPLSSRSYDNDTSHGAKLHIEYTAGGGGTQYDETIADKAVFSDATSAILTGTIALTDAYIAGETWATTLVNSLSTTDSAKFAETLSTLLQAAESLDDKTVLSDYLITQLSATSTLFEKMEVADALATQLSGSSVLAEKAIAADALVAQLSGLISQSDLVKFSDQLATSLTGASEISDQAKFSDVWVIETVTAIALSLSDEAKFADSISMLSDMVSTLQDKAVISDSLATALQGALKTTDKAVFEERLQTYLTATFSISDTAKFGDSFVIDVVAAGVIEEAISEKTRLSDLFVTAMQAAMSLSDKAVMSDAFSTVIAAAGQISDSVSMGDSFSAAATKRLSITNTAVYSDVLDTQLVSNISLREGFVLSDAWATYLNGSVSWTEAFTVGDSFDAATLGGTGLLLASILLSASLAASVASSASLDITEKSLDESLKAGLKINRKTV